MITEKYRRWLAGRVATARTFEEQKKDKARAEAIRIQKELEEFSASLHEWSLTTEGREATDWVVWR